MQFNNITNGLETKGDLLMGKLCRGCSAHPEQNHSDIAIKKQGFNFIGKGKNIQNTSNQFSTVSPYATL